MQCKEKFYFKCIEEREGGSFIGSDGNKREYPSAYIVRFDEEKISKNGTSVVNERRTKVDKENTILLEKIQKLRRFEPVYMIFTVDFITNGVALKLVDVERVTDNK